RDLVKGIPAQSIILSSQADAFIIPAVSPHHVIAISDSNSTPAADMERRSKCYAEIYNTLSLPLMKQTGVGYILLRKDSKLNGSLRSNKENFTEIKTSATRVLYATHLTHIQQANEVYCTFRE